MKKGPLCREMGTVAKQEGTTGFLLRFIAGLNVRIMYLVILMTT